jgi:hypothetical protein
MEWLYNWGGRSFGYKDGNNLYAHDGRNVGKFTNGEIFGPDGHYLGELMNSRLIANISKKKKRGNQFTPVNQIEHINHINFADTIMLAGYEDFPKLEK